MMATIIEIVEMSYIELVSYLRGFAVSKNEIILNDYQKCRETAKPSNEWCNYCNITTTTRPIVNQCLGTNSR
jgi:hypothetical protein